MEAEVLRVRCFQVPARLYTLGQHVRIDKCAPRCIDTRKGGENTEGRRELLFVLGNCVDFFHFGAICVSSMRALSAFNFSHNRTRED